MRRWLCFGAAADADEGSRAPRVAAPALLSQQAPSPVPKKAAAGCQQQQQPQQQLSQCGDVASSSSGIAAVYEASSRSPAPDRFSCDASTSYPATRSDDWDALGACMTTAAEMEACVDAVLEGSIKSGQTLFARYDMNLDAALACQDYYDLMLELNLALGYQDYRRLIQTTFTNADTDRDGRLTIEDFIPLYKSIAAARRAFRRQDHHSNGQIDRFDFFQLLRELQLDPKEQDLQSVADAAFSVADSNNRGIVNFGQTLLVLACEFPALLRREAL